MQEHRKDVVKKCVRCTGCGCPVVRALPHLVEEVDPKGVPTLEKPLELCWPGPEDDRLHRLQWYARVSRPALPDQSSRPVLARRPRQQGVSTYSGESRSLDEGGDVGREPAGVLPPGGVPDAGIHDQASIRHALNQLVLHLACDQVIGVAPDQHCGRCDSPEVDHVVVVQQSREHLPPYPCCLPALVVAVPLAIATDRYGWRRWPTFIAGGVATALVVLLGGWDVYTATWAGVWNHFRNDAPMYWRNLLGLVPLGLTAGVVGGPVLQVFVHHRNEHEATRHFREVSVKRRTRAQAQRRVERVEWPHPADRTVLGLRLDGQIRGWTMTQRLRTFVAPPLEVWGRQALILGETGSGKTVTALTIAAETLRLGWDVYWIDGKADHATCDAFLAAAKAAGVEAKDGFAEPIDGWRGGAEAVVNRLLATQVFTEPYYEGIARTVLRAAVGDQVPGGLRELVGRLDRRVLVRAAGDDRDLADVLRQIPDRELFGVRSRYEGIAWAVGSALDGSWSYEDVPAAYVPVGRPENRNQAAEVGAFLLEDLLHWAMARKARDRQSLVIIDEFSKLSDRPGAAVDLVERVRSHGVGVVLIGQTWASLGPDETTRNRLAGTVGTVVVHQLKQPDEAAALAGTRWVMERTEQTLALGHTELGSQRVSIATWFTPTTYVRCPAAKRS